ncbi:MAG TPA: histidine kinase [Candidatus Limnocylindrales bacterium]|nr:histidine kinase [Candidatus Limnocylindrales bacterium]
MVRRIVWHALWPIGFLFGLGAVGTLGRFGDKGDAQLVSDLLGGWAFMATGLIAWRRLPDRRIGPIAIAVGFAWFVGSYGPSGTPWVRYLAGGLQGWFVPLIAWLALAYPTGRVASRAGRVVLLAYVGVQAAWTAARLLLDVPLAWYPCPTCASSATAFTATQSTIEAIGPLFGLAFGACAAATVVVLGHRLATTTPVGRRRLLPVALTGILIAASLMVVEVERVLGNGLIPHGLTPALLNALSIAVAAAVLAGLLAEQASRSAVADVVGGLEDGSSIAALQAALAAALGDPSLRVLAWDAATSCYRDEHEMPAEPPVEDDRQAVMRLGDGSRPLGIVIHDPALRDDPGLASAVRAAVRLHVENARLEAEVRRQLEDVRASRARLVEAADTERRRLERDLHDGAQQRLVGVALDVRRARARLPDGAEPALVAALEDAATDVSLAIAELRELARGIHPSILTEGGLGPALESLAARSRIPVDLADELAGARFSPSVEATAYFVAAEGLTNAAKAADAAEVRVRAARRDALLEVEVIDDGVGGADPARGSGLRGLEDRITAIGGTLRIESEPGHGTRLLARLPVAVAT